jgi:hypothetical protein
MEMFFLEVLMWVFKVEDLHKVAPYKIAFLVAILGLLLINWRTHRRVKKVNYNSCNMGQARIVFSSILHLHQHKIEDFFYRTYEFKQITKTITIEFLNNKYDEFFRSLQETGVDELSHFNLNGTSLGVFLENCSVEYTCIKNKLIDITLNELENEKKDASYTLKGNFEGINASFGKWLILKVKQIEENE